MENVHTADRIAQALERIVELLDEIAANQAASLAAADYHAGVQTAQLEVICNAYERTH